MAMTMMSRKVIPMVKIVIMIRITVNMMIMMMIYTLIYTPPKALVAWEIAFLGLWELAGGDETEARLASAGLLDAWRGLVQFVDTGPSSHPQWALS